VAALRRRRAGPRARPDALRVGAWGGNALRKLADWFDDDEFKTTMFPETWPERAHEVQDDLRAWATLLEGLIEEDDDDTPA
jgi:hypothetical protein